VATPCTPPITPLTAAPPTAPAAAVVASAVFGYQVQPVQKQRQV
jgi:hypothetical protein